ncbi:MAG: histone [Candidatus Hodarchaeales archaeon]|jgi:histone H3/H4
MQINKGKALSLAFANQECRRLIAKAGMKRISKDAVIALNKLLTFRARQIAAGAVTQSLEQNRKTVTEDDITYAVRMSSPVAGSEVDREAPVAHYVWFISSGGTCLLSRSYSGLQFPDTIFAGLITGIVDLMGEVTGRLIDKITTDDLVIHVRRISEITVAVICDSERSGPIDELTDLLALRFSEVFSAEISQDVIDTSIFEDFTPVLDALVSGAGLNIPKERIKVLHTTTRLTDKLIEETVDAVSLREEMRRARGKIQELNLFKSTSSRPTDEGTDVKLRLDEPPDVSEIKAVLRQARIDIHEEISSEELPVESSAEEEEKISPVEIRKEVAKDLSDIIEVQKTQKPKETKKPKKRKKTTRKRKKRGRKRKK